MTPPGYPNTTSTPWRMSASHSTSAPMRRRSAWDGRPRASRCGHARSRRPPPCRRPGTCRPVAAGRLAVGRGGGSTRAPTLSLVRRPFLVRSAPGPSPGTARWSSVRSLPVDRGCRWWFVVGGWLSVSRQNERPSLPGEGPGGSWSWAAFAVSLPPPSSSLPPGAGKDADKLERYELELGDEGYVGAGRQLDGHASTVLADRDGDEAAVPLLLTHEPRTLPVWR